jgi:alpha-ribazole phosphatase
VAGRSWASIIASPRLRAREPAERLALARQQEARIDADWAEIDFGVWDGRLIVDLQADPIAAAQLDRLYLGPDAPAAPEGESWRQLEARVARALEKVLAESSAGTALIVTHAGPMRAALALACGMRFESLWAIRIDPGTRMTLRVGRDKAGSLWGEVIEIAQPEATSP